MDNKLKLIENYPPFPTSQNVQTLDAHSHTTPNTFKQNEIRLPCTQHTNTLTMVALWSTRAFCQSGIGVVGNRKVTSKCDYMYQQLDGEASISCH